MIHTTFLALAAVAGLLNAAVAPAPQSPEQPSARAPAQASPFVVNGGQWDDVALFGARFGAMDVFLEDRGWVFTVHDGERRAAVRMTFDGAREDSRPAGERPGVARSS